MCKGAFQFRLTSVYSLQSQGHLDQGRELCQNFSCACPSVSLRKNTHRTLLSGDGGVCATSLQIPLRKVPTRSFCQKRTFFAEVLGIYRPSREAAGAAAHQTSSGYHSQKARGSSRKTAQKSFLRDGGEAECKASAVQVCNNKTQDHSTEIIVRNQ